jgi:hypothetical protein
MAAVAADEAAAMAPVAADEAASVTDEAAAAVDEAASATDEAAAATDEAAASTGGVVSVGLLQAARAATATREANRSDLFMNFLEEKFWVRTNTGNTDTRPHGGYPSKRQQAKLEHFLCLARHYTHPYGTFSESQCHRRKTRTGALQNRIKILARLLAIDAIEPDPAA